MVRALEADLFALRSRPTTAPGSRPEPTEVEMPVMPESISRREPAMESSAPIAIADYAEHETNEVDVRNLFEQGPSAPPAPRESAVAAEPQAFDEPEPPIERPV